MPERLPTIRQGGTQVYNGIEVSYGIAPVLNTFANLSQQFKKPYWNLFLINVETIIRDCKNSGTDKSAARMTLTDCTVLAQYIANYARLSRPAGLKERPVVVFYLGHYENIPPMYLREKFPTGTEERWRVRDEIEEILKQEGFATGFEDAEIVFTIVGLKGGWPHKELARDLSTKIEMLRYRKVLMISHVPSDFHLYRVFSKGFNILESYTGAIKVPNQFGKKVFNNDVIPFTKYTHLLYGDKYYLKSLITAKQKRELREIATREHWSILPEKVILQSLVRLRPVQSELFIKPDI